MQSMQGGNRVCQNGIRANDAGRLETAKICHCPVRKRIRRGGLRFTFCDLSRGGPIPKNQKNERGWIMTTKKTEEKKEFATQFCKYIFSDEEKAEMAAEMAQKIAQLQGVESQEKSVKAQLKAEKESLSADISGNAEKINSGYEMRNIKCEVVYNYNEGMVLYIRTDNGELAKERKMRDDERQVKIGE
jgi:hypothetical protein